MDTVDINKLKSLKQTSNKFLQINDFKVKNEDFISMSDKKFLSYIENNKNNVLIEKLRNFKLDIDLRSSISGIYHLNGDENYRIMVYFFSSLKINNNKVGVGPIKSILSVMLNLDCKELLLVTAKELSPKAKSSLTDNITVYIDDNFIDITEHNFVPKIDKIYRDEEVEEFLKENNLIASEMPKMLHTDPLAVFYRGRKGDIFKFTRKINTTNTMKEYSIEYKIIR